jgi:hypothetical protein
MAILFHGANSGLRYQLRHGKLVYVQLVKLLSPITDYLTRYVCKLSVFSHPVYAFLEQQP